MHTVYRKRYKLCTSSGIHSHGSSCYVSAHLRRSPLAAYYGVRFPGLTHLRLLYKKKLLKFPHYICFPTSSTTQHNLAKTKNEDCRTIEKDHPFRPEGIQATAPPRAERLHTQSPRGRSGPGLAPRQPSRDGERKTPDVGGRDDGMDTCYLSTSWCGISWPCPQRYLST